MEEQEQQGHLDAFGCELVGIAGAVALQQAMALEFAQIVAELVEAVGFGGKLKGGKVAWWICFAVHPPTVLPPWSKTSSKRMMRVSWILIPG